MKKILYISNIEVPYRVEFFNMLSKKCDLTVLYERSNSSNRNKDWAKSIKNEYNAVFLDGFKIGNESSFSFKILKYILNREYDEIIIGCYSTPVQMFANIVMRILKKDFFINFDGEIFAEDNSIKSKLKKFFIRGGSKFLIAGEKSAKNLKKIVPDKKIYPYYFSSLTEFDLVKNEKLSKQCSERQNYVLVVGQYMPYKGLDVAVEVAKKLENVNFKFVGMGNKTKQFIIENDLENYKNIETISFLQKEDLYKEYCKCRLLMLPTRQECWGLVINEASSFGTPIVSTYGSGAAVEFLVDSFPELLAKSGDSESLLGVLNNYLSREDNTISKFLINKCKNYCIERSVECYINAFGGE